MTEMWHTSCCICISTSKVDEEDDVDGGSEDDFELGDMAGATAARDAEEGTGGGAAAGAASTKRQKSVRMDVAGALIGSGDGTQLMGVALVGTTHGAALQDLRQVHNSTMLMTRKLVAGLCSTACHSMLCIQPLCCMCSD
jgi:hypothetical protein